MAGAAFFLVWEGLGLYVALDVCRYSAFLQRAKPRAYFVLGNQMLFIFLLPLGLVAWHCWHRARWQAGLAEEAQQERLHHLLAMNSVDQASERKEPQLSEVLKDLLSGVPAEPATETPPPLDPEHRPEKGGE